MHMILPKIVNRFEKNEKKPSKNKMWGGRFTSKPSNLLQRVNSSIHFDYKLFEEDIEASIAHATMLASCKIISKKTLINHFGFKKINNKFKKGNFQLNPELEDIHMNIEAQLQKEIGIQQKDYILLDQETIRL